MTKQTKQHYVYQIIRARSQVPQDISVSWVVLRVSGGPAEEQSRFIMPDKVPNTIDVPEDAVNCDIVLHGELQPGATLVEDKFSELCRAQGMEQPLDARIEVREDGEPNAMYMFEISLWTA